MSIDTPHAPTQSAITSTTSPLPAGRWTVDPAHSRIGFVARHMMVSKVRGSFADFQAEIETGDTVADAVLRAEVQMASIDTGNPDRDGHLTSPDFFDVDRFPTMTLVATAFRGDGEHYTMSADLTIRGVTRPVEFDLEFGGVGQDPWGNTRAGFAAHATINRRDWGIEWNTPLETGGVLVGEKVQVELDVSIVRT